MGIMYIALLLACIHPNRLPRLITSSLASELSPTEATSSLINPYNDFNVLLNIDSPPRSDIIDTNGFYLPISTPPTSPAYLAVHETEKTQDLSSTLPYFLFETGEGEGNGNGAGQDAEIPDDSLIPELCTASKWSSAFRPDERLHIQLNGKMPDLPPSIDANGKEQPKNLEDLKRQSHGRLISPSRAEADLFTVSIVSVIVGLGIVAVICIAVGCFMRSAHIL
ncbi:unnamed protein product [Protopolystoma xenopodis]|uniref:Uncharacterized protein n=1 Tax=Protopolystoma xenopodis TaxID=117903 RepID=A0A448XN40_9PLAT|nr:unnamed protein product [Protopolystoma xenopodis]